MKKLILTFLSLTLSSFTYADFSYSFAQITHTSFDDDGLGDGSSIDFDVSFEITENIFLGIGNGSGDFDDADIDIDATTLSVGYHTPISENADLVSSIQYFDGDTSGILDSNIDGYGIDVGIRSKLSEKVEVLIGVNYVDLDIESSGISESASDTNFGAAISLDLTDSLQALIDVDGDDRSIGLRLNF